MRKRAITFSELRRKLATKGQLVRIKTKMSIKVVKLSQDPDFTIEKLELPSNCRFHTVTFNLSLPGRTSLLLQVSESKTGKLINQANIKAQNGPFYGTLMFYTNQRLVDISFKIINKTIDGYLSTLGVQEDVQEKTELNLLYYLYKANIESEIKIDFSSLNLNLFQDRLKKIATETAIVTKPKTLEELSECKLIFDLIRLFNFNLDLYQDQSEVVREIGLFRDGYLGLFLSRLIPSVYSSISDFDTIIYNLILYAVNNYQFKIRDSKVNKGQIVKNSEVVYKQHLENTQKIDKLLTRSRSLISEKTSINEKITDLREEIDDYKTQYMETVNDLKATLDHQTNLSSKKEAIKRSDYELEKLEQLKDTLLKELNRVKRVKEQLAELKKGGDNNGEDVKTGQNLSLDATDFLDKFNQVVSVTYLELGKDVLQVEEKIQEYMGVLAYFQGHLEQDELAKESKHLTEIGQEILVKVEHLQEKYSEQLGSMEKVRIEQYMNLSKFLELKIENVLLEDYIKYIEHEYADVRQEELQNT